MSLIISNNHYTLSSKIIEAFICSSLMRALFDGGSSPAVARIRKWTGEKGAGRQARARNGNGEAGSHAVSRLSLNAFLIERRGLHTPMALSWHDGRPPPPGSDRGCHRFRRMRRSQPSRAGDTITAAAKRNSMPAPFILTNELNDNGFARA